jgi:hypothetical protein
MVQLDDLALQEFPWWSEDEAVLTQLRAVLSRLYAAFDKFRTKAKGGETPGRVNEIAPPTFRGGSASSFCGSTHGPARRSIRTPRRGRR